MQTEKVNHDVSLKADSKSDRLSQPEKALQRPCPGYGNIGFTSLWNGLPVRIVMIGEFAALPLSQCTPLLVL
jgi:hypothetical protein